MFVKVDRKEFIAKRNMEIKEAKQSNLFMFVTDPGDLVVCDLCNEDVNDEVLYVDDTWLFCNKCIMKQSERTLESGCA
jgi:hypothetical protein